MTVKTNSMWNETSSLWTIVGKKIQRLATGMPPPTKKKKINSTWIHNLETLAYGNRMALRWSCIASPVLFQPFIPPSHTLFMFLLNMADFQFPGLLFHQVAFFFSLSTGHLSHSLSPTMPLFLSLSFHIFFSLLSVSPPPFTHLNDSLYLSFIPPSVHRRCNWSISFIHIVILKNLYLTEERTWLLHHFSDLLTWF